MIRKKNYFIAVLTGIVVLLPVYATLRNFIQPRELPNPAPIRHNSKSPDMGKARHSTKQVHKDLSTIGGFIRRSQWTKGLEKLRALKRDWRQLEKDTYLSNRFFISGMDDLESSMRAKNKKESLRIIDKLDRLISILEAAF
jgi:hypothetical protein